MGAAFLAVAREGLESVFFLLAIFQQSPGAAAPLGALAGEATFGPVAQTVTASLEAGLFVGGVSFMFAGFDVAGTSGFGLISQAVIATIGVFAVNQRDVPLPYTP